MSIMVMVQKRAIAGCALLLASSDAFSPVQSLLSRRQLEGAGRASNGSPLMAGFPPPMGGGGPNGPPSMGGPGGGGGMDPRGGRGGNMGGSQSYNANSVAPNSSPDFSGREPGRGGSGSGQRNPDARGLGAIASGVSTPMDKYGNPRSPERPRRPGGYEEANPGGGGGVGRGYDERGPPGPDPRFDERGPPPGPDPRGGDPRGGGGAPGGRPQNLRYEERDYGEYVTNLRSNDRDAAGPRRGGGSGGGDVRDLEEELERLRKENAMLKGSCRDLMNNFNELSNRLFDVDESLKKVAKVFPDEDEMESLEWLLRR